MTARRFSVITPSFNSSRWLKLCIPSVADQPVSHEHIVQDSCSTDGTGSWLPQDGRVTAVIEKDEGMYDAVNRGYRRAGGEFLSYLNCDEQYLPGALRRVADFFDANPHVDVVFGDCIIVDEFGEYLCDRRVLVPGLLHTLVGGNLSFLTAGCFIRSRFLKSRDLFFNPKFKAVGDADWTARVIRAGAVMDVLGCFTSTFTVTGQNMMYGERARKEAEQMVRQAPSWARRAAPAFKAIYRFRRVLAAHFWVKPHRYSIYGPADQGTRTEFHAADPKWRWGR